MTQHQGPRLKTLGWEHPRVVISCNNNAWTRLLELHDPGARTRFTHCLSVWTDPTDWKHHWVRLGLALCDVVEGAAPEAAEVVVTDLVGLLGEEHDRVAKGRDNIARILALRGPD